jgi:hypothetical protein
VMAARDRRGGGEGKWGRTRKSGLLKADDFDADKQGGKVDLHGLRQRGVLSRLEDVAQAQQSVALWAAGALQTDRQEKKHKA